MFLRLFTLWLCRTHGEVRRILRLLRSYRALSAEERSLFVLGDKRVLRSMRMSFLWALMTMQLDKPHVIVLGLVGTCGLLWIGCKTLLRMAH